MEGGDTAPCEPARARVSDPNRIFGGSVREDPVGANPDRALGLQGEWLGQGRLARFLINSLDLGGRLDRRSDAR